MKKFNLNFIISFLIIGLLGVACNSTNSNNQDNINQESLIPLEVGNSWNFQTKEGEDYATITVENTRIINDVEYHEIVVEEADGETETVFATNKNEGIYLGQGTPYAEFPLKYPVEDGEIYTHTDEDGNDYNITANMKTVETPAGNFSCTEYIIEVPTYGLGGGRVCISPEIGPVEYEIGYENYIELVSYSID